MRWITPLLLACTLLGAGCASLPAGVERVPTLSRPASTDSALGRVAARSAPDPATSGLRLLPSGAYALEARIELARLAEQTLDLKYFLLRNDATGRAVLRALRDAARRGVRVRLLLDDLHTAGMDTLLLGLAAHGQVEVRLFNPFPFGRDRVWTRYAASLLDFDRINHRMHNKLFIADGALAVVGGRNIGDEYFTRHPAANFIDLDALVAGAVLPQLAAQFDRYWNSAYVYPLEAIARNDLAPDELRRRFDDATAEPALRAAEPLPSSDDLGHGPPGPELHAGRIELTPADAQAFADTPSKAFAMSRWHRGDDGDDDSDAVHLNVADRIRQARSEVVITSPYLVPGPRGMALLGEVRRRGVEVGILTNSLASTDEPLVHTGYRRYRLGLLRLGVDLYELSPKRAQRVSRRSLLGLSIGGLHTKTVVIDRELLYLGSMNFDPRSVLHNTEMGMIVRSAELAREVLRLTRLAKLQAAWQLRLVDGGQRIAWQSALDDGEDVHTTEPEAGPGLRLLLELLAPLAPEEML